MGKGSVAGGDSGNSEGSGSEEDDSSDGEQL